MEVVLKYSNVDKQEVMLVLARRDVSILRTWDWFGQKVLCSLTSTKTPIVGSLL